MASSSETSLIGASGYKPNKDGKKTVKVKLKRPPVKRKNSDMSVNGVKEVSGSSSPVLPQFDDEVMAAFPNGKPRDGELETVICKHCKRHVLRDVAKKHVTDCLKSKQEKARKKKEAREAAARAKEKAERGDKDDDDDDDDDTKVEAKGKKRKADGDDDKDKEPKKKKKKEEPKPKAPKPKGPVDVERQCGVTLPNGAQCARSLTCKSHSMGAKRAVPGRSLPYDMLLQAYQKKNQARQQSTCQLRDY